MFKKLIGIICAATVTLCSVFPAFADSTPPIYKVSDNSGHYVYMMGTFHYTKEDTFPIEGIDKVLDDVDSVAFEICMDDMEKLGEQMAAEQAEQRNEETETNGLSDEMLDEISTFIKDADGKEIPREKLSSVSLAQMDQIIHTAVMAKEGLSDEGIEEYLDKLAKERNLKTVSIEDPAKSLQQLESHTQKELGTNGKSKEEAAEAASSKYRMIMFTSFLQGMAIREVLDLWSKGDTEEFTEALAYMEDHTEEMAERDGLFKDTVKNYLANGEKVLVAVGSMHIFGNETGLLKTLTQEGYTVERV